MMMTALSDFDGDVGNIFVLMMIWLSNSNDDLNNSNGPYSHPWRIVWLRYNNDKEALNDDGSLSPFILIANQQDDNNHGSVSNNMLDTLFHFNDAGRTNNLLYYQ